MPRLTVVLPARNAQDHLDQAVRSTLVAMPNDAEILLVDDGSTDETPAICQALTDTFRQVRTLRREGSNGLHAALNFGIANSDSELVARMDADDISLPWRFRVQYEGIARSDFVASTKVSFSGFRYLRPDRPTKYGPTHIQRRLLLGNPIAHSSVLVRRQALPAEGYRPIEAEDHELWLRLAANGVTMERTRIPAILYRIHPGQVSTTSPWRTQDARDILGIDAWRKSYDSLFRMVVGREPEPDHFLDCIGVRRTPESHNRLRKAVGI